jgi:hypothetical protein
MSSSDSRSEHSGADRQPTTREGASGSRPGLDRALLEEVLRKTLAICSSDEPLDEDSNNALKSVVARHAGEPFSFDPVAIQLVAAVLRVQFAAGSNSSGIWGELPIRVARTLYDDPPSRERLETFWRRLNGG